MERRGGGGGFGQLDTSQERVDDPSRISLPPSVHPPPATAAAPDLQHPLIFTASRDGPRDLGGHDMGGGAEVEGAGGGGGGEASSERGRGEGGKETVSDSPGEWQDIAGQGRRTGSSLTDKTVRRGEGEGGSGGRGGRTDGTPRGGHDHRQSTSSASPSPSTPAFPPAVGLPVGPSQPVQATSSIGVKRTRATRSPGIARWVGFGMHGQPVCHLPTPTVQSMSALARLTIGPDRCGGTPG